MSTIKIGDIIPIAKCEKGNLIKMHGGELARVLNSNGLLMSSVCGITVVDVNTKVEFLKKELDAYDQLKLKSNQYASFDQKRDEHGFVDMYAIVQASGMQLGDTNEINIHEVVSLSVGHEFMKQYVAKLNRKTDLPFYLTKVKIGIVERLEEHTDKTNEIEGIKPIE